MSNSYKEDLQIRLKNVIAGTCNTVGCDKCDLKWDSGCSANDLQGKLMDIDIQEMNAKE
ncbi:hypothetical protein [Vibrio alginolyticus]|uniref:hypothetical protein n=1 Tax=Vibrio alginolyticus TaxID=663 RepID=UPI000A814ED6|nr:hypothetical protein [Vibrio alginolyticus]MBY7707943.1 hypothetical protein [Vibrio alginolyticus]